jgi:hypothetical protein
MNRELMSANYAYAREELSSGLIPKVGESEGNSPRFRCLELRRIAVEAVHSQPFNQQENEYR